MPEPDTSAGVFNSGTKGLASLMRVGAVPARLWEADELGAIFRHQMSAPVLVDLGGFEPGTAVRLKTLSEAQGLLLKNFSDLFCHPSPPLELLRMTKDFAKANMGNPESGLPTEIASLLYYASIAAALVRLDIRITQLNEPELRRGFCWALGQAWVDKPTNAMLTSALDKLSGGAQQP